MAYITPAPTQQRASSPATFESGLVDKVKIRMDEIDHVASTVVDVGVIDNKPIQSMIETLLNECKYDVLSQAPIGKLPKVKKTYASGSSELSVKSSIESVYITIPDDAIRIAAIQYADWDKPVTEMVSVFSPEVIRQGYEYIKATNKTPNAAVVDGTTMIAFPYVGTTSGGQTTYSNLDVIYVSAFTAYSDLNAEMVDALCWSCASKVFAAMGMADNSAQALAIYKSLIGKQ